MSEKSSMSTRPLKWIVLGSVFVLLFLSHGFGAPWDALPGHSAQMSSRVHYDPKLTDPFFESDEWTYPDYIRHYPDGHFEDLNTGKMVKDPPRLKHTAMCISTSFGAKHGVHFCTAKLLDSNGIDLHIRHDSPGFTDALDVQIRNGRFTCQFWTAYRAGPREGLTWTTTRQKLTLDKKEYRKGDVIKGRLDFECLDELKNPKYPKRPPRIITVKGVFKTIVE